MVAQFKIVLLAAIFAAARSQAPVGGPHGRPHVARYLRGEGREDEEAPALHYFATDPERKYAALIYARVFGGFPLRAVAAVGTGS